MIIRYGGGNSGIKDYLENGRKVDRHFSRDELDRRVPIEGDLVVTDSIIDTIQDKGQERYLHITMSFNEPDVTEDKIKEVFQQYRSELMSAYADDEFNMYAEIHWPKIKESYNHNSEDMEARYPHVHIVVPKKNLLTGGFLNPLGMHGQSVKYLDAIQEKLNRDNGLSSPRENPRIGSNHYAAALGKYKDKEFQSKNGEVKRHIFDSVMSRDIRSQKEFSDLLSEYGEVRVRNAGKENQYFAVKVNGDQKFTNLKANIFSRNYIENRALVVDPISDAQVEKRVATWRDIQSREIKHIHNASAKTKASYRDLDLPGRRNFLAEREASYEQRHREVAAISSEGRKLPGLSAGNYKSGDFEFTGGLQAEGARDLHELRTRDVGYFDSERYSANRLFLHGDADNDVQHLSPERDSGLRRNLYAGAAAGRPLEPSQGHGSSCVIGSLLKEEHERSQVESDLQRFAEIRKSLDPQHLLAFAQIKYGVDPANHPISQARDGSPRIRAGKLNLNVSDFLTKHIGLDWKEASAVLTDLYDKQQAGIVARPKDRAAHIEDWRRFRDEVYPRNVKTYDQLKNEIKVSYGLGLKAINAEYFARRKSITQDESLTRTDKHYFRSIVILEKLQKIEALQQRIDEQNSLKNRVKYPYSTLFYDYATKNEEISMKVLDELKRRYRPNMADAENTIGAKGPITPEQLPDGAEAMKRARLVAKLHAQEHEAKELKIKLADLRPQPLATGGVAFHHKEHGKQIFVNHPDRLELNRNTEPDEVGVALIYATERFGSPLEINGTPEFKAQVIEVAAERDMDITFADEALNQALQAKRLELGLEPLASNTIAVPEIELDKTIPLAEAADKALLNSKVAELEAVNQAFAVQTADPEKVIRAEMVADALQRHEEVQSGFIDSSRIEDIAKQDLEAFAYLEGKPEQQELARGIGVAMENEAYSAYVDQHGSQELKLTIDASQVIAARQLEQEAPQAAEQPAPLQFTHNGEPATIDLSRFTAPEQEAPAPAEAEQEPQNGPAPLQFTHNGEPATIDLSRFIAPEQEAPAQLEGVRRFEIDSPLTDTLHTYKTEQEAQAGAAELGSLRYTAVMDDSTTVNFVQHDGEWKNEASVLEAQALAREEMERAARERIIPAVELSAEDRELLNKAREEMGMEPLEQPAPEWVNPGPVKGLQVSEQSPEVEAKFVQLQSMQELADDPETHREIFRHGDAVIALDNIEDEAAREEAATRLARNHLEAFGAYEGTPYEQAMAEVIVDGMESNPSYRATIEEESPAHMDVTLKAAEVGRDRAILTKEYSKELDMPLVETTERTALDAKITELQSVNQAFMHEAGESSIDIAVRRGTLVEAELRHDEVRGGSSIERTQAIAREDLDAFTYLAGKPEQQQLALAMSEVMRESPSYQAYVSEHAPADFDVTVKAANEIERQSTEPTAQQKSKDMDIEL